jgi:hypothetical protein
MRVPSLPLAQSRAEPYFGVKRDAATLSRRLIPAVPYGDR